MSRGREGLDTPADGASRAAAPAGISARREAVRVGAALAGCFALYVLLLQDSGFGDGPRFLVRVQHESRLALPEVHYLYLPALTAWCRALVPLGLPLHVAATLLSAVGTTAGVGLVYAATRVLDQRPARAARIAVLVATCPAVFFFATVVEIHGLFFAAFGLCALGIAQLAMRPSILAAIATGVASALAYCVHNSGALLPVVLAGMFLALARERPWHARRNLQLVAVLVAAHAALVAAGPRVLSLLLPGSVDSSSAAGTLLRCLQAVLQRSAEIPRTFGNEFVLGLFPLSVVWVVAFRPSEDRAVLGVGVAALVATGVYVSMTVAILIGFSSGIVYREHGAYLLPLVWPLAWIAEHAFSRRTTWALIGLGLAASIAGVLMTDRPERARSYAAGVRELSAGAPPFLIVAHRTDYEACAFELTEAEFHNLTDLPMLDPQRMERMLPLLRHVLDTRLREGYRVFLTRGALEQLERERAADLPAVQALTAFLEEAYELRPVTAHGFVGTELSAR